MTTRSLLLFAAAFAFCQSAGAKVDLVVDGQPQAEIILAKDATPSVRTAAKELQRHLQAISGALLPIVEAPSGKLPNEVYIGESEQTRKIGFSLEGVKHDGFRILAGKNHVIIAGKEFYNFEKTFGHFNALGGGPARTAEWRKLVGKDWRFPPMIDYRDYSNEFGFHTSDGTGTLYGVYDALGQLGMRWYAPIPELGVVTPKAATVSLESQDRKRSPEFFARYYVDCRVGTSIPDEFLWYKAMGIGADRFVPIYHSLSGPTYNPASKPQEFFGKIGGQVNHHAPRLTNERLREDMVSYLEAVDKHFPGQEYISIGQPDGWSVIDSEDAAAGWDKIAERGPKGRFSDYAWDFNLDIRKRLMAKFPDKKYTVFAYTNTSRPPTFLKEVPENVTVCFTQTSAYWMLPNGRQQLDTRKEWLSLMKHPGQLYIWEYYLHLADRYNNPPVPFVFPKLMRENFEGLYDHSLGFIAEVGWKNKSVKGEPVLARPWLTHLSLYLHNKLSWDRHTDIDAVTEEYYALFYGPAKEEMKAFFKFAEEVWMRPEARQVSVAGGFLKAEDPERFFALLDKAKAKAGDTVYGQRIAGIRSEMAPLERLFEGLKRSGPDIRILTERDTAALIDGDLDKPFWTKQDPRGYNAHPLRDMLTGELPPHISTTVSFRWAHKDSALVIGIECREPKMDKLVASCKDPDSLAIFSDDLVEVRLETAEGLRPIIAINSEGVIYDECITRNLEDLPHFYKVKAAAVKKYPDRWTAEILIDAATLDANRPNPSFPWGINVGRQRMAGNTPEHYMLSPSGTSFKDTTSMGNIFTRR